MKRFLAALAGAIGLGALLRHRQRQRAAQLQPSPAEELRAKLDEAVERADGGGQPLPSADEPPPASETPPARDVEARRREVHERARQTADELK